MNHTALIIPEEWNIKHIAKYLIRGGERRQRLEHTFSIFDLGDLLRKINLWNQILPRVTPYYAVKCNNNPLLLDILTAHGAGFDCASQVEIDKALATGVPPERIIFANTVKPPAHINYARKNRIDLLTFDGDIELLKIKELFPEARLLLRIRSEARIATNPLGKKFGCCPTTEAVQLLQTAFDHKLKVVGICFHVGSGCRESEAFTRGIQESHRLFEEGIKIGHNMHILDIGGGFPGDRGAPIEQTLSVVSRALDQYFPASRNVKIIAEPGRYFAASAFTLATKVHSAKRSMVSQENQEGSDEQHAKLMYFLDNGLYGSFAGVTSNRLILEPEPLETIDEPTRSSSLWGPTCDAYDCIISEIQLPPLPVPSWLLFHSFGAYTSTTSTEFNNFEHPKDYAFATQSTWEELMKIRYKHRIIPITAMPTSAALPQELTPERPTVNVATPPNVTQNVPSLAPLTKKLSPMYQILSPTSTDDLPNFISHSSSRLSISPLSFNMNLASPRELPVSMGETGMTTPTSSEKCSSTFDESPRSSNLNKMRGN